MQEVKGVEFPLSHRKRNPAEVTAFATTIKNVLGCVCDVAPVWCASDVQVKVFASGFDHPRTPARSEIEYVLSILEGNRNLTSEIRSIPFVREDYFVHHALTFAKAIAFPPRPDLTTVLIAALVAW